MLPNFLIIGAQKSGTTALYEYLKQHPEVFMSPLKEPNFFAFENRTPDFRDADGRPAPINSRSVTTLDAYQALFAAWKGEKAIGEASPHYLYLPAAVERIRYYIPEARLIAVLRNPVDRAYSAFLHAIRARREPVQDFATALQLEDSRVRKNCGFLYHYTRMGFYYDQLQRYFEAFDPAQISIYLYDDLTDCLPETMKDLFGFLEVDPTYELDTSVQHNPSGVPRHTLLHAAAHALVSGRGTIRAALAKHVPPSLKAVLPVQWTLRAARRLRDQNLYKPPLPPEVRASLTAVFRMDILKLQDLIGRDLSRWLVEPGVHEERVP